jgi:hypothetical protein
MDNVILLHGADGGIGTGVWTLRRYKDEWLPADGFNPLIVAATSSDPVAYALQVKAVVDGLVGPVHVIGTASGGLVARHYMKHLGGAERVTSCSMLDSTQYGTWYVWPWAFNHVNSAFIRNLNTGDDTPGMSTYLQVRARTDQRVLDGGVWLFDAPWTDHSAIQTDERVYREAVLPLLLGLPEGTFVDLAVT